jgi:transposase InsO family protein
MSLYVTGSYYAAFVIDVFTRFIVGYRDLGL